MRTLFYAAALSASAISSASAINIAIDERHIAQLGPIDLDSFAQADGSDSPDVTASDSRPDMSASPKSTFSQTAASGTHSIWTSAIAGALSAQGNQDYAQVDKSKGEIGAGVLAQLVAEVLGKDSGKKKNAAFQLAQTMFGEDRALTLAAGDARTQALAASMSEGISDLTPTQYAFYYLCCCGDPLNFTVLCCGAKASDVQHLRDHLLVNSD